MTKSAWHLCPARRRPRARRGECWEKLSPGLRAASTLPPNPLLVLRPEQTWALRLPSPAERPGQPPTCVPLGTPTRLLGDSSSPWPDGTSHPRLSRKLCSGKLGVTMKVLGGLVLFWAIFTLGYVTGYFVHKCK